MYVPGKLSDVVNVLIDVGTGYYVEKVRHPPTIFQMYMKPVSVLLVYRSKRTLISLNVDHGDLSVHHHLLA